MDDIELKNGFIKHFLYSWLKNPNNSNVKLDVFSILTLAKIFNNKLNHYYIFNNGGGQPFHIMHNNKLFWLDSEKNDYVKISVANDGSDYSHLIILFSVEGKEFFRPITTSSLSYDIKKLIETYEELYKDKLKLSYLTSDIKDLMKL